MAAEVEIAINARDNYSGVLGNFGNIITGINSLVNLAGQAFSFLGDAALEGLNAIATYERLGLALQTLSASQALQAGTAATMQEALKQTAGEAEALLSWMQELAIKSPFTLEGVANAFRLAEAYGFTADEAQRLTQAMIDFAAGTGASEHVMSQIALALGQIEAKGKLAGQEVLQLVNAGLPVTQILADAFGKTTAEIEKMREDGLIPAQDAIEAITVYLETNFAGAAERQATSWAGLQGTFEDIKQMGLREFWGGIADVLQPLAISLSEFLQTEGLDRLREIGQDLGQMTANFIELVTNIQSIDIGAGITQLGESIINFTSTTDWDQISENIANAIDNINWGMVGNKIAEGLGYAFIAAMDILSNVNWGMLLNSALNAIADIIGGLFGFVDWEDMWNSAMVEFSYVGSQIINWIEGIGQSVLDFWGNIEWGDIGISVWEGFTNGLMSGWEKFTYYWNAPIRTFIQDIKSMLGISSPSSVFFNIARDIIQGLINGWNAFWGDLVDLATSSLDNFLNLFGIDLSFGGTSAGGLGTAGGGTAGGTTTGGLSSGQTTINIYGPSYWGVSGAGDVGGVYDCPSPHPLVASSGNQLVATGF